MVKDEYSCTDIMIRLSKLEVKTSSKFGEMYRALNLARQVANDIREHTSEDIAKHFGEVNQSRQRMDRLEATFATIDMLESHKSTADDKLTAAISKITNAQRHTEHLVYVGAGIVLAMEFLFKFLLK